MDQREPQSFDHSSLLRCGPGGHIADGFVQLRRRPPRNPRRNKSWPTPAEFLLHALAACLTAGLANIAAARGITLRQVSSTVEGDIDLLGLLGLSDAIRSGYHQIRVHFDIDGDASPEQLAALVEQSRRRSAVYDVITSGTDVRLDVRTP